MPMLARVVHETRGRRVAATRKHRHSQVVLPIIAPPALSTRLVTIASDLDVPVEVRSAVRHWNAGDADVIFTATVRPAEFSPPATIWVLHDHAPCLFSSAEASYSFAPKLGHLRRRHRIEHVVGRQPAIQNSAYAGMSSPTGGVQRLRRSQAALRVSGGIGTRSSFTSLHRFARGRRPAYASLTSKLVL
jgi:hypothetical protein